MSIDKLFFTEVRKSSSVHFVCLSRISVVFFDFIFVPKINLHSISMFIFRVFLAIFCLELGELVLDIG